MTKHLPLFVILAATSYFIAANLRRNSSEPAPAPPPAASATQTETNGTRSRTGMTQSPKTSPRFSVGRKNLPVPDEILVDGVAICDMSTAEVSEALLAGGPYPTKAAFDAYYHANRDRFNDTRRALLPQLMELARSAERCTLEQKLPGSAFVDLQLVLRSTPNEATFESVTIAREEGDDASRAIVRECVRRFILARMPLNALAPSTERPFVTYAGAYPNYIPLYFAKGTHVWTGLARRSPN
jgi:hypothetical protein